MIFCGVSLIMFFSSTYKEVSVFSQKLAVICKSKNISVNFCKSKLKSQYSLYFDKFLIKKRKVFSSQNRHYLSRSTQNSQMLPRKSRNFNQKITTTSPQPPPQSTTKQVCKMSPEQVCEKKRVNPRVVEKKMMKRFCRQPKKNSYFDQYLVAKLRSRTTI